MKYLIIILFLLLTPLNVFATDDSCISNGVYDGIRCGVDFNNSGDTEDCSELLICRRPDGGQCSGNVTNGYDCSYNGHHYTNLSDCQNNCGGSKSFTCPTDIDDSVCNGTSPLTQITYRDMYPDDFDMNLTYTYAKTKSNIDRSSYTSLSNTYGGHMASAANYNEASYYWSIFGNGPFYVKEGTLYSDGLFYAPDNASCYRVDSYDGSQWRPRDYCPGNNCSNYNNPGANFQRWEKFVSECTPTEFTQTVSVCLTNQLRVDTHMWKYPEGTSVYYKQKILNVGYDSASFYYKNDYEHYYNFQWYGEEIKCVESKLLYGHNVCSKLNHRIYGPIGTDPYTYDYNSSLYGDGDPILSGSCDNVAGLAWVGPPGNTGSFFTWDLYIGQINVIATFHHNVGINSGLYNASHILNGTEITTTCSHDSLETINDCQLGTFTKCNKYNQTWQGQTWSFTVDCYNHSIMSVSDLQQDYYKLSTNTYTKVTDYRDIPLSLVGIHQWDSVKCIPCQSAASGIVTNPDDGIVDPDFVPDPNSKCTNFYMFSGAGKKCRTWSIDTLFTDCCNLEGWLVSWCNNTERELKKRKQAGTCHYVGKYCSKKIRLINLCVERKKSYCCFNSKLARIINEQGRPQISKTFGPAKKPRCKGFTPNEFAGLDFSRIDLSEYVADIQNQVDKNISTQEITKGIQDWLSRQNNPDTFTK